MLFWVTLVLFVILLVYAIWYDKEYYDLSFVGFVGSFLLGVALLVELVVIGVNNIDSQAKVERYKEQYKSITYKIEMGAYEDEFGLLTPSGVDAIRDWNADVKYYQALQDNFWVGFFIPDIYDQFECIDYADYKIEK